MLVGVALGLVLQMSGVVNGSLWSWMAGSLVATIVMAAIGHGSSFFDGVLAWFVLVVFVLAAVFAQAMGQTASVYDLFAGMSIGLAALLLVSLARRLRGGGRAARA
ncbi:MAG: hypothetical protein V4681_00625 [Patescibacteria group bacterium]